MLSSVKLLICWRGMSMYLHTCPAVPHLRVQTLWHMAQDHSAHVSNRLAPDHPAIQYSVIVFSTA